MSRFKPVLIALVLVLTASAVFAQETATTTTAGNGVRWGVLAAAFVLGIAARPAPSASPAPSSRLAKVSPATPAQPARSVWP